MRVAQTADPIQAGGLAETNTFSIKASAKAFEILTKNLYSDNILAVIREITCNAADAHKMVGKSTADIQVHLPNYAQPWFSVRDFGPGLSIKDMMHLYTTVFFSTKDESNDLIGGLGLGSKAPLAIADQFNVTSWHDSFKSEFLCYKEDGVPKISLIRSTPTTEPTGLLVQVSVGVPTLTRWQQTANDLFKFWLAPPSNLYIKTVWENKDAYVGSPTLIDGLPQWALFNSSIWASPRVLMGGVAYALDVTQVASVVKSCQLTDHKFRNFITRLVLTFNIGDLEIQPSREQLNYDPKTKAMLASRIEQALTDLRAEFTKKLATPKTMWEARLILKEVADSPFAFLLAGKRMEFNGEEVPLHIHSYDDAFRNTKLNSSGGEKYNYRRTWRAQNASFQHRIDDAYYQTGKPVYYWSATQPTPKSHKLAQHHTSTNHYYIVWGETFTETVKLFDKIGMPPNVLIDMSTLAPIPKQPRAPSNTPVTKTTGYTFGTGGNYDRTETALDLKGGGYYVEFFDGNPSSAEAHDLTKYASFGWLDKPVIGLAKRIITKKLQATLDKEGWHLIDKDFVNKYVSDKLFEEQLAHAYLCSKLFGVPLALMPYFKAGLASTSKLLPHAKLLANLWQFDKYYPFPGFLNLTNLEDSKQQLVTALPHTIDALLKEVSIKLAAHYPLVDLLNSSALDSKRLNPHLMAYLNQ